MITWFCVGTAGQDGNHIDILENESDFASIAMLNAMQYSMLNTCKKEALFIPSAEERQYFFCFA